MVDSGRYVFWHAHLLSDLRSIRNGCGRFEFFGIIGGAAGGNSSGMLFCLRRCHSQEKEIVLQSPYAVGSFDCLVHFLFF